jgi:hypothetical protein
VPTHAPSYPNPVPTVGDVAAGQPALPASFYYASKPDWFGSVAWPPIGPDVDGGDVGQCSGALDTPGQFAGVAATKASQCKETTLKPGWGGHVHAIPAMACYFALGGLPDGTGDEIPFDAAACYKKGSSSGSGGGGSGAQSGAGGSNGSNGAGGGSSSGSGDSSGCGCRSAASGTGDGWILAGALVWMARRRRSRRARRKLSAGGARPPRPRAR